MSNAFFQLPAPIGNGVGPAVDVSSLGSPKTILVGGSFTAIVSVETSSDGGVTFGPAISAQGPKSQTITLSATHMRIRVSGLLSGTPVVYVGAGVSMTNSAILDVPAGNGSGASYPLTLGSNKTVVVAGSFGGSINIEVSDDDVNWSPFLFFTGAGITTTTSTSAFMRVTRSGVGFDPGLPVVAVAATADDSANSQATAYVVPPSGTGDLISGTAPLMTLTSADGNFNPHMVGTYITISGATSGANNGSFPVVAYISPTELQYTNPVGVAEAFPGTWNMDAQFFIYVRLSGSDTTGDGTFPNPYATLERAILDVPLHIPRSSGNQGGSVNYIIDVTGIGSHVLPSGYSFPAFHSSAGDADFTGNFDPLYFTRTALTIVARPELTTVVPPADAVILAPGDYTLTIDPATTLSVLTLTVPRPSWAGDALKGKFLFDSTGGVFGSALIASSTSTTLELTGSFNAFVTPIQVCNQSAELVTPGAGLQVNNQSSIQFVGIKFSQPDFGFLCCSGSGAVAFTLCEFGNFGNAHMNGHRGSPFTFSTCYMHDGISTSDVSFQFFGGLISNWFAGQFLMTSTAGYVRFGFGCILDNIGGALENKSQTSFFDRTPMSLCLQVDRTELRNSVNNGINFYGSTGRFEQVRIKDCAGNAISMSQGAGVLNLIGVIGTGNGGVGVEVQDGGQIIADSATTVTGAGGDFKVGSLAVGAWGGPQNVPDFTGPAATGSRLSQT